MRPCYLHCGPHKTGSTTLQRSLDAQRDLLLARKLFVPVLANSGTPCQSHVRLIPELVHLARGDDAQALHWAKLRKILSRTSLTPVLSCEIFSLHFLKPAELAGVIRFLRDCGRRPHFIYYLRDQPAWINSTYVQETKKFYTPAPFADYLDRAYVNPRFDYSQMLGPLIGHPDADLTVLPFDAAAQTGLFDSLLTAMNVAPAPPQPDSGQPDSGQPDSGQPDSGQPDSTRANPNAGVKAVHVGREVAAALAARGIDPRRHRFLYQRLKRHYTAHHWPAAPYCGLDDALAATIRDRFAPSNNRVTQALWGQDWAQVIPPRSGFAKAEFDPETASPADLAEVGAVISDLQGLAGFVADMAADKMRDKMRDKIGENIGEKTGPLPLT